MVTYEVLSDTARVWIYQNVQPFSKEALPQIRKKVQDFAHQWVSHNEKLQAFGDVFHDRFIVLMVDESQAAEASGCSIDASVRFLRQLEAEFELYLFDRMNFSYRFRDEIRSADRLEISELYQLGVIDDQTIFFDNLVKDKAAFEAKWEVAFGNSWHKKLIATS